MCEVCIASTKEWCYFRKVNEESLLFGIVILFEVCCMKTENNECKKYCGICGHYCDWFGDCFAEEEGAGNPLQNNFRGDNFGNRSGICDLFKERDL